MNETNFVENISPIRLTEHQMNTYSKIQGRVGTVSLYEFQRLESEIRSLQQQLLNQRKEYKSLSQQIKDQSTEESKQEPNHREKKEKSIQSC